MITVHRQIGELEGMLETSLEKRSVMVEVDFTVQPKPGDRPVVTPGNATLHLSSGEAVYITDNESGRFYYYDRGNQIFLTISREQLDAVKPEIEQHRKEIEREHASNG